MVHDTFLLTSFLLGGTGGEENHVLSANETLYHNHSFYAAANSSSGPTGLRIANSTGVTITPLDSATMVTVNTSTVGSNWAHNNMPPWLAVNWIIRY